MAEGWLRSTDTLINIRHLTGEEAVIFAVANLAGTVLTALGV
jgi:hypothetical protein